ncbi:MAG: hypothetical protein K6G71_08450 [Clostridiales bacterium]|nr:hypothetical protein [Clostridiales bacterium]
MTLPPYIFFRMKTQRLPNPLMAGTSISKRITSAAFPRRAQPPFSGPKRDRPALSGARRSCNGTPDAPGEQREGKQRQKRYLLFTAETSGVFRILSQIPNTIIKQFILYIYQQFVNGYRLFSVGFSHKKLRGRIQNPPQFMCPADLYFFCCITVLIFTFLLFYDTKSKDDRCTVMYLYKRIGRPGLTGGMK